MTTPTSATRRSSSVALEVVVLLTAAGLVAGFFAMRYGGLWGDSDTNAFAAAIRAMAAEGRLVPTQTVYANGYGFPALATFLVEVTGMSVPQFQIIGGAMLSVWVIIPAWLAYRELTGSARGATLATALVLVQPEFLFPILRGSHEKFTRGLMFLCLYLLVRSILSRRKWRQFAAYLIAFYLAIYALITFNNLFATSFITALALALVLSLFVRQLGGTQSEDDTATRRRLLYAVIISLVLAFFFTFYAYQPARYGLFVAESVWDRLALLFLDVQETAQNPYTAVGGAWISVSVYLLVSIANWLLLGLSFVLWSVQTMSWWRNHEWPTEARTILLWSLYGAFGFLGAFSIIVDLSGALGSNLQHRVFPSFAMIAAAVVADWFVRRQDLQPVVRRLAYLGLAFGIAFLGVIAVAKATNEPLLSNTWQYYSPSEGVALRWSKDHLDRNPLWVGLNERIPAAMGICCSAEFSDLSMTYRQGGSGARTALVSDVIRARAERFSFDLPIRGDSLLIYDNGSADVFHLRPATPFQK